ncbi:hypothetical protein VT84_35705 [Gemmata sp. SH-PL17]|uniref:PEP-CTERM sorting domain-containing protein n=1 Tax=Gemmata sp. SH-PL17 TaxID=1630693 RepID=UPI0004AD5D1A|nr:PEP-CTERM sorting domain-containing protein [Gemmata sp. SH-PL17]AMV29794.1 hypothetical protein VT84_35705 [Gemmata sp. SH-PL17]
MRRATAWVVVVGVAVLGITGPASAADGFWVSIATGLAGSSTPTGYQDWWFETPHGPPPVAVTGLSGGTIEATTGGGSSFFTGGAVPVVVPTTDGYGYLAGGSKPSDLSSALKRQMEGGQGLASAAPDASATAPPANALLLSAVLGDADSTGARSLTVSVTDPQSNPVAGGVVSVPDGGWWVIGLGPGDKETTTNPGNGSGNGNGNGNGSGSDPGNGSGGDGGTGGTPGGPIATPEPATGLLLGVGGLAAGGFRLFNRRRTK